MTYYPDLSACAYFGHETTDKLVAVGWLDEAHAYTQASVNEPFLDKLFDLLAEPWAPVALLGCHDCPWCGADDNARYNGRLAAVGALNLFVPGEGFLYVMPSLAAHYILAHSYTPPAQFQQAVLRCPPMRSPDYFEAIAANAPQKYAEKVRKRYLSEP